MVTTDSSGNLATTDFVVDTNTQLDITGSGTESIGLGTNSIASGENSIGIGYAANATALNGTAVGNGSNATGDSASGFGYGANAYGASSVSLGASSESANDYAMALGANATANFDYSVAIGAGGVSTSRAYQIALGTTDNTYTLAGVSSGGSTDAQDGTLYMVTTDSSGNLATTDFVVDTNTQLDISGSGSGS